MRYLVEIAEAFDRGDRRKARALTRMMVQESFFIIPVLSLLAQLVGTQYQQARLLRDMVAGFEKALAADGRYHGILGKPTKQLSDGLKKHWPYMESALEEMVNQLLPATLYVHGIGQVRHALGSAAEEALAERVDEDSFDAEEEE
jgi:hypothetical protein